MRISVLLLAAGAALALATPTLANIMPDGLGTAGYPPNPYRGPGTSVFNRFPVQQRYDVRVMALKTKMQKLTVQDGGELSLEHKASLQHELDGVNHSFGLKFVQD